MERIYTVPLRKEWLKTPEYKRAKKASTALRQFLSKHMKVDSEMVKIEKYANEFLWAQGIKHPPHKIKVRVNIDDKGFVRAELFGVEDKLKKEAEAKSAKMKLLEEKSSKKKSLLEKATSGLKKPEETPESKVEKPKDEAKAEKPKVESAKVTVAKEEAPVSAAHVEKPTLKVKSSEPKE